MLLTLKKDVLEGLSDETLEQLNCFINDQFYVKELLNFIKDDEIGFFIVAEGLKPEKQLEEYRDINALRELAISKSRVSLKDLTDSQTFFLFEMFRYFRGKHYQSNDKEELVREMHWEWLNSSLYKKVKNEIFGENSKYLDTLIPNALEVLLEWKVFKDTGKGFKTSIRLDDSGKFNQGIVRFPSYLTDCDYHVLVDVKRQIENGGLVRGEFLVGEYTCLELGSAQELYDYCPGTVENPYLFYCCTDDPDFIEAEISTYFQGASQKRYDSKSLLTKEEFEKKVDKIVAQFRMLI